MQSRPVTYRSLSLWSVEASLVLYILIAVFYALPVDRFLNRIRLREERTQPARTRTRDIE